MNANELLWFASRATGIASIALLTAVLVLGLVTAGRRGPGTARGAGTSAVVMGLHRTLALGSVAFLVAHIGTAIAETYVNIDLISAVVPFTSGYETAWVGLGSIAVDLAVAVLATSLLRHRLPERLWRAVHVLAFAAWPLAVAHGFLLGTADQPLLRETTLACGVIGVLAMGWRLWHRNHDARRRAEVLAGEWS